MFYVIPDTLLKVSLNTNKTGHHVLSYTWHLLKVSLHIVESVKHQLNTNKTGHHVLRYTWHIVESVIKHQ